MKIVQWYIILALFSILVGCGSKEETRTTEIPGFAQFPPAQQTVLVAGKQVYEQYCSGCHGVNGDGKGPAAEMLITKPRDFTKAMFKFKLTPSGSLPHDEDVLRTINSGVSRTSMASWALIPEKERFALVQYLKTFSDRWKNEKPEAPIYLPDPPQTLGSLESVLRGKQVYADMQCGKCHGERGLGDGPSAAELVDQDSNPIKPFNFTTGILKGGRSVKDIYRTFTTGLDGTPMPSYAESIPEVDRWHLISYVLYLMKRTNLPEAQRAQVEQFTPVIIE